MSKELAVKKDIQKEHDLSVIEQVVMQGDLSKLTPNQRVIYYNKVCESMGLNPYTRPFDYISLNGKLTLYAKKDATEQLRQVRKISITGLEGRMVDDIYMVVAKATTPDGRLDQATGAVSIGNLKGEQKANALMKAETKSKRRVTLSICGMGWIDESEIEHIPNARKVNVDMQTGDIIDISNPQSEQSFQNEQNTQQAALPAPSQNKPPVTEKVVGFDEFCSLHGLLQNTRKAEYVRKTAEKMKMNTIQIINAAIKNEKMFIDRFEKWQKENPNQGTETPRSMDELAQQKQM